MEYGITVAHSAYTDPSRAGWPKPPLWKVILQPVLPDKNKNKHRAIFTISSSFRYFSWLKVLLRFYLSQVGFVQQNHSFQLPVSLADNFYKGLKSAPGPGVNCGIGSLIVLLLLIICIVASKKSGLFYSVTLSYVWQTNTLRRAWLVFCALSSSAAS